jgi:hypothetical protein
MSTLHIEHKILDFDLWKSAFDRFADLRLQAGVRSHRIQRPIDDPHDVIVEPDFDTTAEAHAFAEILRTRVWASQKNAPALSGTPQTRLLEAIVDENSD